MPKILLEIRCDPDTKQAHLDRIISDLQDFILVHCDDVTGTTASVEVDPPDVGEDETPILE